MVLSEEKKELHTQHAPIDFVDQYISHTRNTGTLLSLGIGLFTFSSFFRDKKERYGSLTVTIVALIIFVYNVVYSVKSIRDFRAYLRYFEPIKDEFDPIYTIYLKNWKEWMYFQSFFVFLIILVGIALAVWRIKSIFYL